MTWVGTSTHFSKFACGFFFPEVFRLRVPNSWVHEQKGKLPGWPSPRSGRTTPEEEEREQCYSIVCLRRHCSKSNWNLDANSQWPIQSSPWEALRKASANGVSQEPKVLKNHIVGYLHPGTCKVACWTVGHFASKTRSLGTCKVAYWIVGHFASKTRSPGTCEVAC